jgi:CRP/FNR family transcriptional regulator, anaerobic regulatory protein
MPVQVCERCVGISCVTRVPIFKSLDNPQRIELLGLVERKQLKKGEILLMEGTTLAFLGIVNRGRLKAYTMGVNGKQQILYFFSLGDFFGEHTLFSPMPVRYTLEALEDSGICMIQSTRFQPFLKAHPSLALDMIRELAVRLDSLENNVVSISSVSAEERIFDLLKEFGRDYGTITDEGVLVKIPMTREEIGNRLGLTRETVSRRIAQLVDEEKIEILKAKRILIKSK